MKIDVESMKPAEHNTQNRTPVSATESGGSPELRHQERSAVPVLSEHAQSLSTGAEVLQVANRILREEDLLALIASNDLQTTPPRGKDDHEQFLAYVKEMRVLLAGRKFRDSS